MTNAHKLQSKVQVMQNTAYQPSMLASYTICLRTTIQENKPAAQIAARHNIFSRAAAPWKMFCLSDVGRSLRKEPVGESFLSTPFHRRMWWERWCTVVYVQGMWAIHFSQINLFGFDHWILQQFLIWMNLNNENFGSIKYCCNCLNWRFLHAFVSWFCYITVILPQIISIV